MYITKTCPVCKNKFETAINATKFCSDLCRSRAKENAKIKAQKRNICVWCSSEFFAPRRKSYCSTECRLLANGRMPAQTHKHEAKKPCVSIEQIAALSKLAGMSYGEYVHKFNV